MYKLFSIIIVFALILSACHPVGRLGKNPPPIPEKTVVVELPFDTMAFLANIGPPKPPPPPPIDPDTVFVASLQRTPCYGKCPHYTIELFASGLSFYHGRAHVKNMGRYSARIDSVSIEKLLNYADSIDYMAFAEQYPVGSRGVADFPMCITVVRKKNRKKIIYNRNDAPLSLVRYEKFFDAIFENVDWKKIEK